jgi:hypothetical protein
MSRKIIRGDEPDRHKRSEHSHRRRHVGRTKLNRMQVSIIIVAALTVILIVLLYWH